jgi:Uma2 family endonuclease
MTARARERSTYEDLLRLPGNVVGEIIDGELFAWPRPSGSHGDASSVFLSRILTPYRLGDGGPGGWWIIGEPEVHFVRDTLVVVPDIGGWRRERMPEIPKEHRHDRGRKMRIYAEHKVSWMWLVDPEARTVEVLQLNGEHWTVLHVFTGDEKVIAEPFPAAEIDLAAIWGPTVESPLPPP